MESRIVQIFLVADAQRFLMKYCFVKKYYFNPQIQNQNMFRFLLLIVFFAFVIKTDGQYTYPPYRQYTLRDGLSQMQVTGIIQDSRGYIWVGTKNGLNCFDGQKFINFKKQQGLHDKYISSLAEDSFGNIWASTRTGLVYFDGKEIKNLDIGHQGYIFLASSPDGKVWYAGRDYFENAIFGYVEDGKNHDLSDVLPVRKGNFFIKYARKADAVILTDFTSIFEFKDNTIKRIASTSTGNEFALFENELTVAAFEHSTEKVSIQNILEYRDGEMVQFAINAGNEIKLVGKPTGKFFITPHPYFHFLMYIDKNGIQQSQFENHTITSCLIDKDSTLWLGTEEGLIKVIDNGFDTYKREYLPVVWSMVEDNKQNIWFASYSFGLRKFDGDKIVEFKPDVINKYASGFNFQAQTNGRGGMYFPNNRGILFTDGIIMGKFGKSLSLAAFYDVRDDLLYSGCNKYVEVYDKNQSLVDVIDENDGLEFKGFISSFGSDSSGYIWFGGYTGVCRYQPENRTLKNYNRTNGNLPSDGVLSVFTDHSGRTWFGGTDGLLWFDETSGAIQKLNSEEIQGTVNFVTSIDSAWLVFSQSEGIYLMNLPDYYRTGNIELYFFNDQNGFSGIDPGQNGSLVDSKGNIWMTTSTEVVKLDPKKLKLQKYFSAVRFSAFNGEQLAFNSEKVELPKNERSAVFVFDAVCFNRPNPVEYSWKLATDTVWSGWQEENYAVVTHLPDGNSKIQLRARFPGLPGTQAETALIVKVKVAIWKQSWFFPALFGFFAVLALSVFVLFIQTRTKMIQTTRQAKIFQVKAIQSQMNPHFIFNVLASFQSMILSLNIEKANQYLVKLAALMRGFLDASSEKDSTNGNEKSGQSIQKEIELIEGFVEFQQLIYPGKFKFIVKIADDIDMENETVPPMILQPFVENAIRHGLLPKDSTGNLWLSINRFERKGISITIKDDGIGIEKADKIIHDSPFRYESKGTVLTVNRIRLLNELGYQITIKTESSATGTKIIIIVPKYDKGN
jgi:ligand-binding sensor domain-containing protein